MNEDDELMDQIREAFDDLDYIVNTLIKRDIQFTRLKEEWETVSEYIGTERANVGLLANLIAKLAYRNALMMKNINEVNIN